LLRRASHRSSLVEVFKEFWWVILFVSFTCSGFVFAASSQKKIAQEIQKRIESIQEQKNKALSEKEYLEQKLYSKDDPAYVELTLIKVLGVTPKGQQKVLFNRAD